MLQAQHQLDQLRLRKPLEFLPIHRQDESHTGRLGKGVGNYVQAAFAARSRALLAATKRALGFAIKQSESAALAFLESDAR